MLLTFFGYIMVISSHAAVWINYGASEFIFEIVKITVFLILGFVIMNQIRLRFNINKVMKLIRVIVILVSLMMLATLLFPAQNGAQAWIRFPGMSIQPVEFLKITMILYFGYHFGRYYKSNVSAWNIIKMPLLFLIISFVFVG
jgi:cell division protein FtsW